jgi:hypothetical protein
VQLAQIVSLSNLRIAILASGMWSICSPVALGPLCDAITLDYVPHFLRLVPTRAIMTQDNLRNDMHKNPLLPYTSPDGVQGKTLFGQVPINQFSTLSLCPH